MSNNNLVKQTHYETLGVKHDATDVEIKRCFRRLSMELHPDRSQGNETKYKQVVEAYSVLGDNDKRVLYDLSLKETRLTKTTMSNNRRMDMDRDRDGDRDSIRERNSLSSTSLIEIEKDNWRNRTGAFEHSSFDNRFDDFDDDRHFNPRHIHHDNSYSQSTNGYNNYGYRKNNRYNSHGHNHGNSRRFDIDEHQTQNTPPQINLEDIQQSVHINLEDAFAGVSVPITIERRVNGVSEEARVYVDIPRGTDNGEIIILEGKGHIDSNIRMRSHVRVKVVIDNHVVFRRDRLNIIYDLDITLKEALCGFRKEILHLDGRTYMIASEKGRIISQGGRRCITGKGFQRGQTMGNLIIVFNIVMPKSLTDEQIQRLAKILE